MDASTIKPSLRDLQDFIGQVPTYPVSAESLLAIARRIGAPQEIIDFYGRFRPRLTFRNHDDLLSRSEQVDIMRAESLMMPREEERAPEED